MIKQITQNPSVFPGLKAAWAVGRKTNQKTGTQLSLQMTVIPG